MIADPGLPGPNNALFGWSHRAISAGRITGGLAVAQAAAWARPSSLTAACRALLLLVAGETAQARALADGQDPAGDFWVVRVKLALWDGDLESAADLLQERLAARPMETVIHYQLASLLPHLGRFREANAHAARGPLIRCGDGLKTTGRIVRFPDPPFVIAAGPAGTIVYEDFGAASQAAAILVVGCDSRYFCFFAEALVNSVVRNAGCDFAIHFHLVNPDAAAEALLARLRAQPALPIVCSREVMPFDTLGAQQRRTYLACARYLVLPDLLRAYQRPLLVTDADQLVIGSLAPLLEQFAGSDVGLLRGAHMELNILSLISASVLLIGDTERGRRFAQTVRAMLLDRMRQPFGLSWHLDQAALAVAYLWDRELRTMLLPETLMDSVIDPNGPLDSPRPGALFWSITMSFAHNAAKLNTRLFTQFLR